jgi:hypothetical protein
LACRTLLRIMQDKQGGAHCMHWYVWAITMAVAAFVNPEVPC